MSHCKKRRFMDVVKKNRRLDVVRRGRKGEGQMEASDWKVSSQGKNIKKEKKINASNLQYLKCNVSAVFIISTYLKGMPRCSVARLNAAKAVKAQLFVAASKHVTYVTT